MNPAFQMLTAATWARQRLDWFASRCVPRCFRNSDIEEIEALRTTGSCGAHRRSNVWPPRNLTFEAAGVASKIKKLSHFLSKYSIYIDRGDSSNYLRTYCVNLGTFGG
jgi:hypothetical protein